MEYENFWKRRLGIAFIFMHYLGVFLCWTIPSIAMYPLFGSFHDTSLFQLDSKRSTEEQGRLIMHPGLPMINYTTEKQRIRRYLLGDSKWDTPYLTYKISQYSTNHRNSLTKDIIDSVIQESFSAWSKVSKLRFIGIFANCTADIDIRFEIGDHNCNADFDGPEGYLGHASYPQKQAFLHLDDDEMWVADQNQMGKMLAATVIHEIGHILGIDHSTLSKTVMTAKVHNNPAITLYDDDINAIRALYSNFESTSKPCTWMPAKTANLSLPICNERNISVKAMFHANCGNSYAILKDDRYVELGPLGPIEGESGLLKAYKSYLPPNIDAAFTDPIKNFTIFFKDNKYWRFRGSKKDKGYPKFINESFPNGPDKVDAASIWLGFDGYLYLFQGFQYWVYEKTEFNDEAFPRTNNTNVVSPWNTVPDSVDAAFNFDDFFYIFRGEYYVKFSSKDYETNNFTINNNQTSGLIYPRKIFEGWFSCSPGSHVEITHNSSIRYRDSIHKVTGILHDEYRRKLHSSK